MKQPKSPLEGAPIYVTANALMNNDITLGAAMEIARAAGADGFELRRELLPPTIPPNEIQDLRSQLQTFAFPPAYSIPLPLCKKGCFEPEPLHHAMEEARAFGCHLVKFSPIGMEPGDNDFAWLSQLRSLLQSAAADLMVCMN